MEEDSDDDVQSLGLIKLAENKAEKKIRQRERKASAKRVELVDNGEDAEVITINHIKKVEAVEIEEDAEVITINRVQKQEASCGAPRLTDLSKKSELRAII